MGTKPIELADLINEWMKDKPVPGVKFDERIFDDGNQTFNFRCSCSRETLLGTVYHDSARVWWGLTLSTSHSEDFYPTDPKFFDKLKNKLLAKRLECIHGPF